MKLLSNTSHSVRASLSFVLSNRLRLFGTHAKRSYIYLVFFFLYAPILILMIFSFSGSKTRGHWGGFSLKWYTEMFHNANILQALVNTLLIAFISAIVATIIGTIASIGIHFMKNNFKSWVMNITYIPVIAPDIVLGVSLMLFFLFVHLRMGFWTIVLAHISFNIPYVILSILPKLKQLNPHLFEAAEDLGASKLYTIQKVILPEIKSGIINGFLLAITLSIDDFVVSFFTKGAGVNTLSTLIYAQARKSINPSINALSSIMFVVILAMLIIVNKRTKGDEILNN